MKSILDRSFVYRNSTNTNIKLTFARIKREQKEKAERERLESERVAAEQLVKVRKINMEKGKQ